MLAGRQEGEEEGSFPTGFPISQRAGSQSLFRAGMKTTVLFSLEAFWVERRFTGAGWLHCSSLELKTTFPDLSPLCLAVTSP